MFSNRAASVLAFFAFLTLLSCLLTAQDSSSGAIRGTVSDPSGGRIAQALIVVVNTATGGRYTANSDAEGRFVLDLLPPGDYSARVEAAGMSPQVTPQLHVDVGGTAQFEFHLTVAGAHETLTVSGAPVLVDTKPSAVSTLLDPRAMQDFPLNGRRFSDLALFSPGVTQDPRSLNSSTNGDLSVGGVRGFQNSFMVEGGDYNNAFFAQARGRYRAPYQFSTEVVQEFRVSTTSYGAEQGRSGGAVVNVVMKSGSNHLHGSGFYYLRDSSFGAANPFLAFKPHNRQQQLGGTVGGPLRRNKIFFFAGFDQHIFHAPNVVEFLDGSSQLIPQPSTGPYTPGDYEATDQALVFEAAGHLTSLAGVYPAAQIGNTAYGKLDITLNPHHQLGLRLNTTRYWGANNVFLDPASPVTFDAISNNGQELVSTETASLSLTSSFSQRWISHLRAQFSRDLQQSSTNTNDVLVKLPNILNGIGRSNMLPRQTREHRLHLAETVSLDTSRNSWKFGGDALFTWLYDFFPSQQCGEYLFYPLKVNPFTFEPQEAGMKLTPLRAYAHEVPHYYLQSFGSAISHPDSNDYAAFAQDTVRVTDHLAVNLGVRWDLQTFTTAGLISNPLFPPSGKVPFQPYNFAPRAGLRLYLRQDAPPGRPRRIRYFLRSHPPDLQLDRPNRKRHYRLPSVPEQHQLLRSSSLSRVSQSSGHVPPLCSELRPAQGIQPRRYACGLRFRAQFRYSARAAIQHYPGTRNRRSYDSLSLSLLNVHGEHLIRALDVNLPLPVATTYPIFDSTGSIFQGGYYTVDTFATWQFTRSLTARGRRVLILSDDRSRNSAPSTNSRAPPAATTTAQPSPSIAA